MSGPNKHGEEEVGGSLSLEKMGRARILMRTGRRRDGGSPGRDGGTPGRDGGSPERDGGTTGRDGGSPGRDGGSPGRDGGDGRFRNWKHSLFHVGKLRLFIPHVCENKFPVN